MTKELTNEQVKEISDLCTTLSMETWSKQKNSNKIIELIKQLNTFITKEDNCVMCGNKELGTLFTTINNKIICQKCGTNLIASLTLMGWDKYLTNKN